MNDKVQESNPRAIRKAIPLPDELTLNGNQKTVYNWLSVHPGKFHAATIGNFALLNTATARRALDDLARRGIIQIEQWNDENYDPLYTLAAIE
jgi:hypothetical protein